MDPLRTISVERSTSPPPAFDESAQFFLERDLENKELEQLLALIENTELDQLLSSPTPPPEKLPAVPDQDISGEYLENTDLDQLPSLPTPSPMELPAVPDQEIPLESWEEMVIGWEPNPSPTPLAELLPVWMYRHSGNGPLCTHNAPARGPEEEPERGRRPDIPDSKDPFMGHDFPCAPDDGLEELAKSSLDAVFRLPKPFGPTPSEATLAEPICDMKRELDQIQFIRDRLWRVSIRQSQTLCRTLTPK